MSNVGERLGRLTLILLGAVVVTAGWGVSRLPQDLVIQIASVMAGWLTLSLPIGIIVGHCILDEVD